MFKKLYDYKVDNFSSHVHFQKFKEEPFRMYEAFHSACCYDNVFDDLWNNLHIKRYKCNEHKEENLRPHQKESVRKTIHFTITKPIGHIYQNS